MTKQKIAYSIGDFAKAIGKTEQTLRNWHKEGKLIPFHVSESGHRYYSENQLDEYKSRFFNYSREDKIDTLIKEVQELISVLKKNDN